MVVEKLRRSRSYKDNEVHKKKEVIIKKKREALGT